MLFRHFLKGNFFKNPFSSFSEDRVQKQKKISSQKCKAEMLLRGKGDFFLSFK